MLWLVVCNVNLVLAANLKKRSLTMMLAGGHHEETQGAAYKTCS